jgi:hypothetical protein
LDNYCAKYGTSPRYNQHLAAEVKERLQQLQYIIDRVRQLERGHDNSIRELKTGLSKIASTAMAEPGPPQVVPAAVPDMMSNFWEVTTTASSEIRVLTEAFYYFAARIRAIAQAKSEPLPHLSFECKGVRDVRNHLIEHPDRKDSLVLSQSFSFGGTHGPVLKDGRPATEPAVFPDRGLYWNAEEFESSFLLALERALG